MRNRVLGEVTRLLERLDADLAKKEEEASDETKRLQAIVEKLSGNNEQCLKLQQENERLLEELAALKQRNEELQSRASELEHVQRGKEKRRLRDRTVSLENKENQNLPMEEIISALVNPTVAHIGVQTEKDSGAPGPSLEDKLDLTTSKNSRLQQNLKHYKEAHAILENKYRRDKEIWRQWINTESHRTKKVKDLRAQLAESNLALNAAEDKIFTLIKLLPPGSEEALSILKRPKDTNIHPISSPILPPTVSPERIFAPVNDGWNSSPPIAMASHEAKTAPKSPARRAGFLPAQQDTAKTQEPTLGLRQAQELEIYDSDETTDGECSRVANFSPTSRAILRETQTVDSPTLPSMGPPARIKKEKHPQNSPVVIKSEPRSSNSMDHFVFTQQSLDLDDIGDKPETPRKPRLMSSYQRRGLGTQDRRKEGYDISAEDSNEGLAKILPELAHGMDEDVQIGSPVREVSPSPLEKAHSFIPTLPVPLFSGAPSMGIYEDTQPAAYTSSRANRRASPKHVSENPKLIPELHSSPPQLTLSTETGEAPIKTLTPKKDTRQRQSNRKTRSKKDLAPIVTGIEFMTEDGTDGVERLDRGSTDGAPGKDKGLLSNLLGSAPMASPSIAHLRHSHEPTNRSVSPLSRPPAARVDANQVTPIPNRVRSVKRHETPATEPPVSKRSKPNNQAGRQSLPSTTAKSKGKGKGKAKEGVSPVNKRQLRNKDANELKISDFLINPEASKGLGYAFQEVVRKKDERKCLPSCARPCCAGLAKFVEHAGIPDKVPSRAPKWRSSPPAPSSDPAEDEDMAEDAEAAKGKDPELAKRVKRFSEKFLNHRDHFERPKTPPGFWDSEFPSTQQIRENNRAARQEEREKIEEMRREARRGGGRYVFRDEV